MNTLDLILLVPLAYFAWKGFSKGFIITLAMLVGILLGIYAAIHFSEFTASYLHENMKLDGGNIRLVAYLLTFILVLVLVYLLGHLLTSVVNTTGLGVFNRIAGLFLGIVKGLLIIGALLVFLNKIDPKSYLVSTKLKTGSLLYNPVSDSFEKVFPLVETYTGKAKELINGKQ